MKLYNTLTRQIEPVRPLDHEITVYSCGPTVYHFYHIGNLRNAVFNDTLKRVLIASGSQVHHVMNITDVGHLTGDDAADGIDKFATRAAAENKTVWDVIAYYTDAFVHDMKALGVIPPRKYVPATSAINRQLAMIGKLYEHGHAYVTDQAIYFDVTTAPDYGKLTGQKLTEKEVSVRSEVVRDPDKRSPADFALWFFTVGHFSDHAMRWPSPWGEGFPGWHLECSAIIEQEFGETIDIHTGGVDHIGTHHTNEIAQSEAAHSGAPLANHWMHIEFLLVDGAKMSKSLGNTYSLGDLTAKDYDPMALRLLYLQSHYRREQNFTFEALDAATNLLHRLRAWSDGQHQAAFSSMSDSEFHIAQQTMLDALQNDLATPLALAALSQLVDIYEKEYRRPTAAQLAWIDEVLGLDLANRGGISSDQAATIRQRELARAAGDYTAADSARGQLEAEDIHIDDTPHGPRWRRSSPQK